MRNRSVATVVAIAATGIALLATSVPASIAASRPGRVRLVSMGVDGRQANGSSGGSSFSRDGRLIAFSSEASNLVPGDTNGVFDVFLLDRGTGRIQRLSETADGRQGDGPSTFAYLSADGRFVAFESKATNLDPADPDDGSDIFVRDLQTGAIEVVSRGVNGTASTGGSHFASLSADGRYVCFYGNASNLVAGDTNDAQDVFVHDRQTGTTELVSVAFDGALGNNSAFLPSMSEDGRFVAWESYATNMVPLDTNFSSDVFVRDRQAGTTQRASVSTGGAQGDSGSLAPAISGNGRYVAFTSYATNLVPSDTNGIPDVFLRDLQTGTVELASADSLARQANGSSFQLSLSFDGRYLAFESTATNLVSGDTNGASDVFVHDRETGVTRRVSEGLDGADGDAGSFVPRMSPDGRSVTFQSWASNLVPDDVNGFQDVFVSEGGGPVGIGGVTATPAGNSIPVSGWASFSPTVLTSVSDPGDDAVPQVAEGELRAASVIYRPEEGDLLVRLRLTSVEKRPGVVYGLSFEINGVRHEVRAIGVGVAADGPATPYFALHRCEVVCVEQARLAGGMGTGAVVAASIPLTALGIGPGAGLTDLQAFAGIGEAVPGAIVRVDEAALPDSTLPAGIVTLGIAPAGTPEAEVSFDIAADVSAGQFSGALNAPGPGRWDVWARACLGSVCEAAAASITTAA